jgi:pyridoxine 4-dehydrogenase
MSPRFQAGNVDQNLALVEALRAEAKKRGASVAEIAIAWVLAKGEDIVPVIGARRREQLKEALRALDIKLSKDDAAALERAAPREAVAGERYNTHGMATLDSERG